MKTFADFVLLSPLGGWPRVQPALVKKLRNQHQIYFRYNHKTHHTFFIKQKTYGESIYLNIDDLR